VPDLFGRYELLGVIGRGGMGEVFRAHDMERERIIALKLLSPHLATDDSFKARFRRESRLAARLNDPHIIPIHDFGEIEGRLFIDMRLVEGRDLGSIIETDGPLPPVTAVKIISQVASALDAAHRNGLIHRDVKPSNILIAEDDEQDEAEPFAYLVDFGIARPVAQDGTALTATTGTVGTVAYMSPERIAGQIGDKSTDVYALGCVLYEAITGRKPFGGEPFAIMYAHLHTPPPDVSATIAGVPPALDAAITRSMAKEATDRQASAGAFAAEARRALQAGQPHPHAVTRPVTPPQPPHASLPSVPPAPDPATVPVTPALPNPNVGSARPAAADEAPWRATPAAAAPVAPPPSFAPVSPPFIPPRARPRRRGLIYGAAGVAVAAGAVIAIVLNVGNGTSGHGSGANTSGSTSTSVSTSSPPSSTPPSATPTSFNTGDAATPVEWAHFASFSRLVGTSDNDTANAFLGAACHLRAGKATEEKGLVDIVLCPLPGTQVTMSVWRFGTPEQLQTFLNILTHSNKFTVTTYTQDQRTVGRLYRAPANVSFAEVLSVVCGLPNYMVEFFAQDNTQVSQNDIVTTYWKPSIFPDPLPPACNSAFSGPLAGATPLTAVTPAPKTLG